MTDTKIPPKKPATFAQSLKQASAALRAQPKAAPRPAPPRDPFAGDPRPAPSGPRRKHKPRPAPRPRVVGNLVLVWPDEPVRTFAIGRPDINSLDPDGLAVVAGREGRGPRMYHKQAVAGPKGPAEIVAHLEALGVRLVPTGDGMFGVEADRGALAPWIRDAIAASAPLLRPYLHGTPRRCSMPYHVGSEPPLAVELSPGGAGWCGECGPS